MDEQRDNGQKTPPHSDMSYVIKTYAWTLLACTESQHPDLAWPNIKQEYDFVVHKFIEVRLNYGFLKCL